MTTQHAPNRAAPEAAGLTLSQIQQAAEQLVARFNNGTMSSLEMGIEMAAYRFVDATNRYWYLDPYRQHWYTYKEKRWQLAALPGIVLYQAGAALVLEILDRTLAGTDPGYPKLEIPQIPAGRAPKRGQTQPSSEDAKWELVITSGPDTGSRYPIRDRVRVGRETDNDVCLPRRQISRHHAMLECTGDRIQLVDMGSVNGTYINGDRITHPVVLSDGDAFTIHDSRFTVVSKETQPPAPPAQTNCPSCGASVPAGNKFCSQCGSPII